jgi:uncharacterized protein (DUF433 family)
MPSAKGLYSAPRRHRIEGFPLSEERLIGIGLYTPAEAAQLVHVPAGKITRWLRGHEVKGRRYERLWRPQVDLRDGHVYLGFRDLMEIRVANAFIARGLSPQRVRRAIDLARGLIGEERPLSTTRFRTDGRTVFLQVAEEDGSRKFIDLFRSQYAFQAIIEPSLRNIEFDSDGIPLRWWPGGKGMGIVVDPRRSFGQPIEAGSGVPTDILAAAAKAEGSVEAAARVWRVKAAAVRRAMKFQGEVERLAA